MCSIKSSLTTGIFISVLFTIVASITKEDSDFLEVKGNGKVYLANDISSDFPDISAADLRDAFQPDETDDAVWWNGHETPERRSGKSMFLQDPPPRPKPTCYRQCQLFAPPLLCYFRFRLEEYVTMGRACGDCPRNVTSCTDPQCITGDGFERSVLVVNRKMPGPNIQVCKGDVVVVDVKNMMPGRISSIHWHGIKQRRTPHMDGVSMVTQCPIPEGGIFRYRFIANDHGTHMWYSHDGLQKMDGAVGAFVVRIPREKDPSSRHYDFDIKAHTIVITDWMHATADSKFPGHRVRNTAQMPDSYLINGRGGYERPRVDNSTPQISTNSTNPGHNAVHNQAHHSEGSSWPQHRPHGNHHGPLHHLLHPWRVRPTSPRPHRQGQKARMETDSEDDLEDWKESSLDSDYLQTTSQSSSIMNEGYVPSQDNPDHHIRRIRPTDENILSSRDYSDPFEDDDEIPLEDDNDEMPLEDDNDEIPLEDDIAAELRTFTHLRGIRRNDTILQLLKGRIRDFFGFEGNERETPYALFRVTPDMRYRFRLIGGNSAMCPFIFTIENHRMNVIAVDGDPVKAVPVDSITIFPGERYDVVVHANRLPGAYWISVRGTGVCTFVGAYQVAVLRYSGLGSVLPKTPNPRRMGLHTGVILNADNKVCRREHERFICIRKLESLSPMRPGFLRTQPNSRIILNFNLYEFTDKELFRSGTFRRYFLMSRIPATTSIVNNMSNLLPPSPLISQIDEIPDNLFCNLEDKCRIEGVCECLHIIHIPLGSDIELILADLNPIPGAVSTPFHLHGHSFRVAAQGLLFGRTGFDIARSMASGQSPVADRPPLKDTIAVPSAGFVVLRFFATNPGYWLLNCGYIYRSITGMSVIFQVGTPTQMPQPPPSFPRCGDFLPSIH